MALVYSWILNLCGVISLGFSLAQDNPGFEYLWMLPATYLLCYNFLLRKALAAFPLATLHIVIFTIFLRAVFLPFWMSQWPQYGFAAFYATGDLLQKGCLFICYEVLFVSVFFLIVCRNMKKNQTTVNAVRNPPDLQEGYHVYIVAVAIALAVLLLVPSARASLHFLVLSAGTGTRVAGQETSFTELFCRQILITGIGALVVIVLLMNYRKKITLRHCIMVAVPIILCMGVLVGEMRSVQVYAAAACFFALSRCYPEKIGKLGLLLGSFAVVILLFMTIYKTFYAFNVDSYADLFADNTFEPENVSYNLEAYIFGPACAASVFAMETSNLFAPSFSLFFYDLCRPVMGLNLLFKTFDFQSTSEIFNLCNTLSGLDTSGLLIPISGHTYLFFGWLLSPVTICIFYFAAIKLECLIKTTRSLFLVFWGGYYLIRLSTCMVSSNIPTVMTSGSMVFLFTCGFYLCQNILDSRNIKFKEKLIHAEQPD